MDTLLCRKQLKAHLGGIRDLETNNAIQLQPSLSAIRIRATTETFTGSPGDADQKYQQHTDDNSTFRDNVKR